MNISILSPPTQTVMLDESYCLAEVSFPERIPEIGALRIRVWSQEPGVDPVFFGQRIWIDSLDQTAHHWIVTLNNIIVASARMSFHDTFDTVPYAALVPATYRERYVHKRIASINRLVVDPRFRGRGIAKVLDQVRLEAATNKGMDVVLAQPQKNRLGALEKFGFEYLCELPPTAEMPGRPLYFMELDLNE